MKTILKFRFLLMVLIVGSFMACKKNDTQPVKLSTNEMAQRLYTQQAFVDFAGSFAKNFKYLADYYQTPSIVSNKESFIQNLRNAGDNEVLLEAAHLKFGVSLKEIERRRKNLDNDLFQLCQAVPELINYSGDEFWSVVKQSTTLLYKNSSSDLIRSNDTGIRNLAISPDEVWDCFKGAVGLGAGGMLGIAGLHALASKKGIQQAVVKFAALMAKNLAYIGLAITVLDFSSCMYKESMD